jgi:mannose-1-phosphate guanylyltransferase/mannose-1-phosphate guanylyltransferase/mannose-6-phosphate isomerase
VFLAAVREAERAAQDGSVVTLGIQPTYPATGFGYIELESKPNAGAPVAALGARGFREKPNLKTAEEFVASGRFVWNAGIFVFKVEAMIANFKEFLPELWAGIETLKPGLENLAEVYRSLPSISIDYGVMEKLKAQKCVPCDPGWSDLGSWDDVVRYASSKPLTNEAQVYSHASSGCHAISHREKVIGFLNVDDLIVIDSGDAMLISKKGTTQDVRHIFQALKDARRSEVVDHKFEIRPWGKFEVLLDEEHFKSKKITVNPGSQLSLQSHTKRAENWIIVRGTGEVVLNDQVISVKAGASVFIPVGAKHRARNTGTEPLEFIEVQTGTYFGEDDIIRYQDDYQRT